MVIIKYNAGNKQKIYVCKEVWTKDAQQLVMKHSKIHPRYFMSQDATGINNNLFYFHIQNNKRQCLCIKLLKLIIYKFKKL